MNLPSRRFGDEAGAPELLEVLRGVGDRQPDPLGQRLDAALALRQMLEQLEPVGMPQRPGDPGELGEDRLLRTC